MNIIKSILLVCALCTPTIASEWQCDSVGGTYYKHQVIDLPQDQGQWYLTLMGNGPQLQQLANWFDTNPDLRNLKEQTHFHVLDSNSVMFKSRYASSVGDLPCVRIQRPDGTVVYQCSANRLPLSAEALANSISKTCLRRRNVEPAQPDMHYHLHYQAEPEEKPEPKPNVQPDVFLKQEDSMTIPIWTFIAVGVVAAVAGVAVQWSQTYRDR